MTKVQSCWGCDGCSHAYNTPNKDRSIKLNSIFFQSHITQIASRRHVWDLGKCCRKSNFFRKCSNEKASELATEVKKGFPHNQPRQDLCRLICMWLKFPWPGSDDSRNHGLLHQECEPKATCVMDWDHAQPPHLKHKRNPRLLNCSSACHKNPRSWSLTMACRPEYKSERSNWSFSWFSLKVDMTPRSVPGRLGEHGVFKHMLCMHKGMLSSFGISI